ncbi:unnamed protein product [Owenia fusiformis]|uniref:Uncharacterized protein n=1 Tax=Owenia fusiformis TaxID=6347 RepID=A0A8J1XMN9_OWEFU|nr:unnamed protein product [Owenia fusiformis]
MFGSRSVSLSMNCCLCIVSAIFDTTEDAQRAEQFFNFSVEYYKKQEGIRTTFVQRIERIYRQESFEISKKLCILLRNGMFALFGITNSRHIIDSYSETFHMPYISPSLPRLNSNSRYLLHMRPLYSQAMIDVIHHYGWTSLSLIYDSDEALSRLDMLYQASDEKNIELSVDLKRISDPNDAYETLRHVDSLAHASTRYIVLDLTSEEAVSSVLQQIRDLGMNRGNYHYLIAGLTIDQDELRGFRHGGVNITAFRLIDLKNREIAKFYDKFQKAIGSKSKKSKQIKKGKVLKMQSALMVDSMNAFVYAMGTLDTGKFRGTIRRRKFYNNGSEGISCAGSLASSTVSPWEHGEYIMEALKKVKLQGLSGHVEFDKNGFRKNYTLDVIGVSLKTGPEVIGSWNDQTGLSLAPVTAVNDDIISNLANKTLRVTTILTPPYASLREQDATEDQYVGNDRYEGYCIELAAELAAHVGFKYEIIPVADEKYGAVENGTWNGMVGELIDKVADMAIAPLTISSQRERVIDFSKPFMSLGISIMIKKPEKQKPGVFSFMDPLSTEIWMCIVFSFIGVSVVMFLVSRFSPYEWHLEERVTGMTVSNDFTMFNSLWFSLGALMQQGSDISPRSISGRIAGSVWWFFTLITISSYTANLAAFLTVERMVSPIESADDLARQSEIAYGTVDSGSTKEFFKNSKLDIYKKMWTVMNTSSDVFVPNTQAGVDKVRKSKGKYAFLLESSMNDYHNQRKPCNTMIVGGNLDDKGYGIATPLNSNLREKISLAVLQLREKGVLAKLQKKWWFDKGECGHSDVKGSTQNALTLSNVAGIFYILIGGLGLSMVVSLLEFFYKSKTEARKRKTSLSSAMKTKARLSIRGSSETENGGYMYSPPQYKETLGYNTHTEV